MLYCDLFRRCGLSYPDSIIRDDILDTFENIDFIEDDFIIVSTDDGYFVYRWDADKKYWYRLNDDVFRRYENAIDFIYDVFYIEDGEYGYRFENLDDMKIEKQAMLDIVSDIVEFEKKQGRQPASWVVDEDIWEKAKNIADKFNPDNYWAFVTYMYKKLGGRIGR